MKKLLGLIACSALLFSCNNEAKVPESSETAASAAPAAEVAKEYEFGDAKYIEVVKKGFANLASGDIDSWMTSFADNAVYRWNNFDSLVGKAAIADYWKKRRSTVIDSMSFTDQIWLPVKVNTPQVEGESTGNYALCWNVVHSKYKTGKSMSQRIHTVFHFDANDKIDQVFQYLDRVPINAAMAKK